MLARLSIHNLALIERAELELGEGLNVLTGETGAGKTMLAQAIGLLTGAQPVAGMVGPFADEAYVEAEFDAPPDLLDDPALAAVAGLRPEGEETLVVARRLTAGGRSRALVWGRSCARADLEALGERLIEMSSQHEARRLARPARQLELLDAFAGTAGQTAEMAAAWRALREAEAAFESARGEAADAARRRLDLEDLVARVDQLAPAAGEPEALRSERERLRHLDELAAAAGTAAELLSPADGEGARELAAGAAQELSAVGTFAPELADVAATLDDIAGRIQDAAVELRGHLAGLEADPARLEHVEARLEAFTQLERRYAAPLGEVVEQAGAARRALERLESSTEELARLEAAAVAAREAARDCADGLTAARAAAAEPFARAVEAELADLGMAQAVFAVRVEPADTGPRGADRAVLELAASPTLAAGPVAETASGGELSRIALAIRVAARAGGGPGILLLDEVDAGIGGRTARAVADKLAALARGAQLLVITHLPQIARAADAHFLVEKPDDGPAKVVRLGEDEVVEELARMLGGDPDDEAALRHAEALRS
ncbi:MAG TPA: AAA family ATPase [Gaiellales bacterium]|nr:AAA family ATPase [Gaiellales bacterium]